MRTDVTRTEFVDAVFDGLDTTSESVALAATVNHKGKVIYPSRGYVPFELAKSQWGGDDPRELFAPTVGNRLAHTAISSLWWLDAIDEDAMGFMGSAVRRLAVHKAKNYALVFDEFGETKIAPDLQPTWRMQTKPSSEQWGYRLRPTEDWPAVEAVLDAAIDARHCDPSATDSLRLVRLPGSLPLGKKCAAELVAWEPERIWDTPAALMSALGLEPPKRARRFRDPDGLVRPRGLQAALDADPLLRWLYYHGDVLGREPSEGWLKIRCPWFERHTNQDTSSTSYLWGRTNPERGFLCRHNGCSGARGLKRTKHDFLLAAYLAGAPIVPPEFVPGIASSVLDALIAQRVLT